MLRCSPETRSISLQVTQEIRLQHSILYCQSFFWKLLLWLPNIDIEARMPDIDIEDQRDCNVLTRILERLQTDR